MASLVTELIDRERVVDFSCRKPRAKRYLIIQTPTAGARGVTSVLHDETYEPDAAVGSGYSVKR